MSRQPTLQKDQTDFPNICSCQSKQRARKRKLALTLQLPKSVKKNGGMQGSSSRTTAMQGFPPSLPFPLFSLPSSSGVALGCQLNYCREDRKFCYCFWSSYSLPRVVFFNEPSCQQYKTNCKVLKHPFNLIQLTTGRSQHALEYAEVKRQVLSSSCP